MNTISSQQTTKPYLNLPDVLIAYGIQKVVILQIKNFVGTAKKEHLNNSTYDYCQNAMQSKK
jgi:hypothetical protein